MQPCNDCGSFLIRGSKSNGYSLSVRDTEKVRHYKIERSNDGAFFVTQLISFETLSDLVAHYRQETDGLCVTLKNACLIAEPPQIDEDWEIDSNSISLVKKLGGGQFGEMWMGVWNGTTEVAVKALKPGTIGASELLKEASVMKNLRHPGLVQLYGVCTKKEPVYIITELMKLGSLLEYLRADGRSLKLPQLIDMGAQVASGMAYLEWKNYVHRDLSARNILIGENLVCKVGSFGSARVIDEHINEAYTKENFPINWAAPEVVMYSQFTTKSDVWSFGILLYELITYGCSPYPEMNDAQVLEALQTGYHMPSPMGCPEQLYEIMKECWRDDAASRPTFGTLQLKLEEFFFTSV